MVKKEGESKLDPRLEGVNLYDPDAVLKALGGNEWNPSEDHFDLDAYLRLPIGKRLLTHEEFLCLDIKDRRSLPIDLSIRDHAIYDALCIHEGNGGENPFDYNWNP